MSIRIKLIISDFDGPINRLTNAKRATIKNVLRTHEISPSDEIIAYVLNYIDFYYIHEHLLDYEKLLQVILKRMVKNKLILLNNSLISSIASDFKSQLTKNLIPNYPLLDSFKDIKKADPKIKICIYTNQVSSYIEKFFETNKIDASFFDFVYGSNHFLEKKPSIENLKKICADQDTKYNESVMIGDDPVQDLMPARLLGMQTILFNEEVKTLLLFEKKLQSLL